MNTTVSFEIAKLLKEKDFDKTVGYYYGFDGYIGGSVARRVNWNKSKELLFSAPNIAEVVMWLYEKHGDWISVQPISIHKWKFYLYTNSVTSVQNIALVEANSPTEACEAAIGYALNNLIP